MKLKLTVLGVGGGLVVAGAAIFWLATTNNGQSGDRREIPLPDQVDAIANIGEQLSLDEGVGFTVKDFQCDSGSPLGSSQSCRLKFEVQNLGDDSYFSDGCGPYFGDQIELFDSQGNHYPTDGDPPSRCRTVVVPFEQGQSVSSQLGFQVPQSAAIEGAAVHGDYGCREVRAESNQLWTEDCHYSRQGQIYFDPITPSSRPGVGSPIEMPGSRFGLLTTDQSDPFVPMGEPLILEESSFTVGGFNCQQLASYLDDPTSDDDQLVDQASPWSWLAIHARNLRDQLEATGLETISLANELHNYQTCELTYDFNYSGDSSQDYSSCRVAPAEAPIDHRIALVDDQGGLHPPHPSYFCPSGFKPGGRNVHERARFYFPSQRQPRALIFQGNHQCQAESLASGDVCTYVATSQGRVNLPEASPCFRGPRQCYLPDSVPDPTDPEKPAL